MNEHKILEEAFKEEFGDNWQIEMRDFEHGFSSFYDASINAIKRALVLSNVSDSRQGEICQICHGEMNDFGNVCSECDDSHLDDCH